jgi:hypothetical protein
MRMCCIGWEDALFKSTNCTMQSLSSPQQLPLTTCFRDEGVSVLLRALGIMPALKDAWSKLAAVYAVLPAACFLLVHAFLSRLFERREYVLSAKSFVAAARLSADSMM